MMVRMIPAHKQQRKKRQRVDIAFVDEEPSGSSCPEMADKEQSGGLNLPGADVDGKTSGNMSLESVTGEQGDGREYSQGRKI